MTRTVAVTGATGFVGRHAVAALAAEGWQLRVLARSQPAHVLWKDLKPRVVLGSLDEPRALQALVKGVDAVLHLAGAIKARDEAEFLRINRDGSRALAEAVLKAAPNAQVLHVSSLAAREPQLSGYALSKRQGEEAMFSVLGTERVSVIRPPAVYGPGDRETLVFFQLARQRLVPLLGPDHARIALIHVADAARMLAAQLDSAPSGQVQYIADAHPAGYSWREILGAAAAAVGNAKPRFVQVPRGLLRGLGHTAGAAAKLAGQAAMFNSGKLNELLHEDWSVPTSGLLRLQTASPQHGLADGFKATAEWYAEARWLHPIA